MKLSKDFIDAAHREFHMQWWQCYPSHVCTRTCGEDLKRALKAAVRAGIKTELIEVAKR